MTVLELMPQSWLTWDFDVLQGGSPVAEIDVSWWREKGVLTVGGSSYDVYREYWLDGAFVLKSGATELARAQKPSWFVRSFSVESGGRTFTLEAESFFGRTFVLLEDGRGVGSISPKGILTREATVHLPHSLPLPVQVFLIWLTVILWKRAAES